VRIVYVMYPDPETALVRLVNIWVNFERFVVVATAAADDEVFVVDVRDEVSVLAQLGLELANPGPH
jgi:hypothetical protein